MSPTLSCLAAVAGCAPGGTARARVDGAAPFDARGFAMVQVDVHRSADTVAAATRLARRSGVPSREARAP
jgi:hypothetical protein